MPAPGWEVFGTLTPTHLEPGGKGLLTLFVYNVGEAENYGESVTLVDTLPEGLEAQPPAGCSGTRVVTCNLTEMFGVIPPSGAPTEVLIPVSVAASASNASGPVDLVSVTGGGALGPADARVPVVFGSGEAGFGFANADGWITNADGTADTQAGSHPYELTVVFAPNVNDNSIYELPAGGEPHTLNVNLPAGLIGEPGAVPKCPRALFDAEECPARNQDR